MTITDETWDRYIAALRTINEEASRKMFSYLAQTEWFLNDETKMEAIKYAYALATGYGDAATAVACEMYDEVVAASVGVTLPPAIPAETATFSEVAKAVNGTMKTENIEIISGAVGRLVKMAGVDTTMQNAIRDGAEWAWIPRGDTCAFCLTLASRGWQRASAKALKNGHAEHIHAHCDCTYAIRFDSNTNVRGYNPEKYKRMYYDAEGSTPNERINSMRRQINTRNRSKTERDENKNNVGRGYDIIKAYHEDATPGKGTIDIEKGYQKERNKREIETANIIHKSFGGDLVLKAEISDRKNPDYEWMGRLWDLKTTTTAKAANSAIKSGMKQIKTNPGGIVLNFEDNDFSMTELKKIIDKRMQWYPKDSADIMIISKGKVLKILRY